MDLGLKREVVIGLDSTFKLSCSYKNQSNFLNLYTSCPKDKNLQFLLYLFRICNISFLSTVTYAPLGNVSDISLPSTIFSQLSLGTVDLSAISWVLSPKTMEVGEFGSPFFQEPTIAFVRKVPTSGTGQHQEYKGEFAKKIL